MSFQAESWASALVLARCTVQFRPGSAFSGSVLRTLDLVRRAPLRCREELLLVPKISLAIPGVRASRDAQFQSMPRDSVELSELPPAPELTIQMLTVEQLAILDRL